MEAGQPGTSVRREADIAPAPEPAERAVGWSPADPGPLGLAAFAATTFMLSMFNSNLVRTSGLISMLGVAFAYGGIVQILAGMWEFRTGNTFGAVVFSSYGAFWVSFFLLVRVTPAALLVPHAVSVYLYGWAIFTLLMLVASLRTTGVIAVVFVLLTITFFLLAIGWATLPSSSGNTWIHWGGYFGLATAAFAWLGAFAAVVNSTFGRILIPVFPLKR
jgi:uncharacterized protein